ncbi:hypothetical protein ACFL6S_14200 [Candidatus Poribacteria bacterium]
MGEERKLERKLLEIDIPRGVTVSPTKAAKLLGVAVSELKKRSSQWGIRTYWDTRGRRYVLKELEAAKNGLLDPLQPLDLPLDFASVADYRIPEGFGFLIYLQNSRRGRYFGPDLRNVKEWIQGKYGNGRYFLRLMAPDGRLTRYSFVLQISNPDKLEEKYGESEQNSFQAASLGSANKAKDLEKNSSQ